MLRTRTALHALAGSALVMGLSSHALAGPDWLEQGDAGSTITGAQKPERPQGATGLTSISGNLAAGFTEPDYEDLYYIRITDPANFSIRPAFADFNVVLYLFNITVNGEGFGLLGNDNESPTSNMPKLTGMSTDGTGVEVTVPGDYVLAVTGFGRVPVSRNGAIFNFQSPTEISGPDGPGGFNPLRGWTGVGETGHYSFTLQATDFPIAPAPGAGVAVAAGMGAMMGRRRRR
jgi:hypothetical protein